ncbi:MAG TPA: hypothetical protein VD883_04160 [Candidatus Omnitrophota bacterium]|nr:hypothetical protein [Candidatus Omnitrophota bacterium]
MSNRVYLILCVLIILTPGVFGALRRNYLSDHYLRKIIVKIEGEAPLTTNFHSSLYRVPENKKFFGGKALELEASQRPEEAYFVSYAFNVPKEGRYDVVMAGTPPGPLKNGSPWHSPYFVRMDEGTPKLLTEEELGRSWPHLFEHTYVKGGYYFTNLGAFDLSAGKHVFTLTVGHGRLHDQAYVLYIDALFIAPTDFEPAVDPGTIPKEVFYD